MDERLKSPKPETGGWKNNLESREWGELTPHPHTSTLRSKCGYPLENKLEAGINTHIQPRLQERPTLNWVGREEKQSAPLGGDTEEEGIAGKSMEVSSAHHILGVLVPGSNSRKIVPLPGLKPMRLDSRVLGNLDSACEEHTHTFATPESRQRKQIETFQDYVWLPVTLLLYAQA